MTGSLKHLIIYFPFYTSFLFEVSDHDSKRKILFMFNSFLKEEWILITLLIAVNTKNYLNGEV